MNPEDSWGIILGLMFVVGLWTWGRIRYTGTTDKGKDSEMRTEEITSTTESVIHALRRGCINSGFPVSIIAYDTMRELFVFDLSTCGYRVSDGNRDDPTYAYCGLRPDHAGSHGAWKV